ncbi:DUF1289 domain-containing protein [Jannaschia seosinensis]|nr:DUF1289 domain-containing protein [Jannaschia seosinensis]
MAKIPSPCIDVCKFRRTGPEGAHHCIACSMTKPQKRAFKLVKAPGPRAALVRLIALQQEVMGRYDHWRPAYLKRCRKKDVTPPL